MVECGKREQKKQMTSSGNKVRRTGHLTDARPPVTPLASDLSVFGGVTTDAG
jgi:hypothetical protein